LDFIEPLNNCVNALVKQYSSGLGIFEM